MHKLPWSGSFGKDTKCTVVSHVLDECDRSFMRFHVTFFRSALDPCSAANSTKRVTVKRMR